VRKKSGIVTGASGVIVAAGYYRVAAQHDCRVLKSRNVIRFRNGSVGANENILTSIAAEGVLGNNSVRTTYLEVGIRNVETLLPAGPEPGGTKVGCPAVVCIYVRSYIDPGLSGVVAHFQDFSHMARTARTVYVHEIYRRTGLLRVGYDFLYTGRTVVRRIESRVSGMPEGWNIILLGNFHKRNDLIFLDTRSIFQAEGNA